MGRSEGKTNYRRTFTPPFDLTASSADQPSSTSTDHYFFGLNGGTYFNRLVTYRPTGSGTGNYTLGIAADVTATNTDWGTELVLDTTYRVVMSYSLTTGASTLWVNPVDVGSTNVTSAAGGSPATSIDDAAFRLGSTAAGDKSVDNLIVATTFAEAVPEPSTCVLLGIGAFGAIWTLQRRASRS